MVLTGSSAGYNYNQYSDIDLHIIVNKDKIGCPKLVDDFLFDKRKYLQKSMTSRLKIMMLKFMPKITEKSFQKMNLFIHYYKTNG